jgi:L,D-peptidoglycan transpeptidase YkuD (ErfK/YbiS/YcfS/YnhG family)
MNHRPPGSRPNPTISNPSLAHIHVRSRPGDRARGWLTVGPLSIPVALGRSGIKANKREGDGGTPRGRFHLVRLWWRADRAPRPRTLLPVRRIGAHDAWCEDPHHRLYNRPVHRAPNVPGDRLRRADHLYDFIIEIDHNTRPRVTGRGSAVFIHLARPGLLPTAGCIALTPGRLRFLLARCSRHTRLVIE